MPTAPNPVPDAALLCALREGSTEAAEALFRRYAGRVRATAAAGLSRGLGRILDADDIVQSVFRRFLRAARDGRYRLAAHRELWDLLRVITRNLLRSEELFHRADKRDLRQTVGWDEVSRVGGRSADALAGLAVDDAVNRLPAEFREIVRLRMDGYEVAEIAARTDRSRRTVERMLKESRARLRSLLHLEP